MDRLASGGVAQQNSKTVHGTQQQAGRVPIDLAASGTHVIQEGLQQMGEIRNPAEAEGAGAALDRMYHAKYRIQYLGIGGHGPARQVRGQSLLYLQQRRLHADKPFLTLAKE